MESRAAGVTMSVVEPLIPFTRAVAAMVVEPTATLVASPWLPGALLTTATAGLEELQVTEPVRFWVEPSLAVPNDSPVISRACRRI